MTDIAVGATVFTRGGRVENLLDSIEHPLVDNVYIADNGKMDANKREIYNRTYPFHLSLLNLQYDAGLAYSRNQIVEEMEEDLLLLVDCDMELPENIEILYDQLMSKPDIGGISGTLYENGIFRGAGHNLYEESLFDSNDLLVRDIRGDTQVEMVSGHPFVQLDQIPNAALFRAECLKHYPWDPKYRFGEHFDFFVGHKKNTDWTFGASPKVVFPHNRGGYEGQGPENLREKKRESKNHFENKWGYRHIIHRTPNWMELNIHNDNHRMADFVTNQFTKLPPKFQGLGLEFYNLVNPKR